jgi:hypothetical protein
MGFGRRWLVGGDAPLLLAGAWTVVLLSFAAGRLGAALRGAERQRGDEFALLAELAAEAAAVQLAAAGLPERAEVTVGAFSVSAQATPEGMRFLVARGAEQLGFAAERLPGAAPAAFGVACALGRTDVVAWRAAGRLGPGPTLPVGAVPPLDPAQLAAALPAAALPMFRRDGAVALHRLPAGTEGDDYAVDPRQVQFGLPATAGVVEVPGHLWLEPGGGPWRPWLDHDVTVVVRGNFYCAASVEPVGPGRLVFVVVPATGAVPIVDRDGNGRWSPGDAVVGGEPFRGPLEGGGGVYFGRPGAAGGIELKAALWAQGELHLWVPVRAAGAVLAGGGVTALAAEGRLEPLGALLFATERERVPGFAASGPPRCGRLRPWQMAQPAAAGEELLYLAGPAR